MPLVNIDISAVFFHVLSYYMSNPIPSSASYLVTYSVHSCVLLNLFFGMVWGHLGLLTSLH